MAVIKPFWELYQEVQVAHQTLEARFELNRDRQDLVEVRWYHKFIIFSVMYELLEAEISEAGINSQFDFEYRPLASQKIFYMRVLKMWSRFKQFLLDIELFEREQDANYFFDNN